MNDIFIPLSSISHLPVLKYILNTFSVKNVLEFGVGYGSTKLFLAHECKLTSIESDFNWCQKFSHNVIHCRPREYIIEKLYDLVFIDCHPSEDRLDCLQKAFSHTSLIVVHDTEPISENEYGYSNVKIPLGWSYLDCTINSCWTTIFTNKSKIIKLLQNMQQFDDQVIIDIVKSSFTKKDKN